jgi:hypothetical protein
MFKEGDRDPVMRHRNEHSAADTHQVTLVIRDRENRPDHQAMAVDQPGGVGGINAQALSASRITAIDLVRGIVMIIMVIDHVRHFYSWAAYDPADLGNARECDRAMPTASSPSIAAGHGNVRSPGLRLRR